MAVENANPQTMQTSHSAADTGLCWLEWVWLKLSY